MLAKNSHNVSLWGRDEALVEEMNATRHNPRYISDVLLPPDLLVTWDMERAVEDAGIVVMAVPSHAMRDAVRSLSHLISDRRIFVSLAKGLEDETFLRMTEVIGDEVPGSAFAALSGPNHAEEVSVGIPTATVVSARDKTVEERLQEAFMTSSFRVYTNPDLVGVEMGGASKNIIAIAAGISDGLGFGDNTKASLMTRGLAEMTRLGDAMGANPRTFAGLSGMGDLIATCTSNHSRNRAVGERLGRGESLEGITAEMRMVAEGVRAARAVYGLSLSMGIELPITSMVYDILYNGREIDSGVAELMLRDAARELPEDQWA